MTQLANDTLVLDRAHVEPIALTVGALRRSAQPSIALCDRLLIVDDGRRLRAQDREIWLQPRGSDCRLPEGGTAIRRPLLPRSEFQNVLIFGSSIAVVLPVRNGQGPRESHLRALAQLTAVARPKEVVLAVPKLWEVDGFADILASTIAMHADRIVAGRWTIELTSPEGLADWSLLVDVLTARDSESGGLRSGGNAEPSAAA